MIKTHELEALSERYLASKKLAPSTIKSYRIAFKHYINYLKKEDIYVAKTSDLIRYKEIKKSLGHSIYYIYVDLCAIKGLYRYLKINQHILNISEKYLYDIAAYVKNERMKPHISKRILTLEEVRSLILCTKHHRKSLWHFRDHAIIYLMLTSGLRPYEIMDLKRSDYKIKEGKHMLSIKSSYVTLSKGGVAALNDYLKLRKDDNPYLFVTNKNPSPNQKLSRMFYRDMFERILKTSNLSGLGITPHALRHTAGVMNLLRGDDILSTMRLLRHEHISSTLIYQTYLDRLHSETTKDLERFILKEDKLTLYETILSYLESYKG